MPDPVTANTLNTDLANTDLLDTDAIAIIGMAGRFPGATNVDEFWQNLRDGVETISHFSAEELAEAGVDPILLAAPNFVKAYGALDDVESFDAAFFGIPPREAEIMDPQHRLFLECAWQALEDAGYDSEQYDGAIGVYAGAGVDTYALNNLFANPDLLGMVSTLQASVRNRTDHLTTSVAYKLNLKGPGVTVQTACSTSLVAVHLACQSLLNGESDMTLAGGVSISVPQKNGYLYTDGGILSPDGHCRAFDADAQGTVGGSGVGIVVLKRFEDAQRDGDTIHAVIRGSAINNDGSLKVGYTAPGVDGQADVIAEALAVADVDPETISYIETHGTGTALGDPIEVEALTRVYRSHTDKTGYCALGAVKSSVGHLDTAAGVTGLIKTVQALKHQQLPPSLHYSAPNPRIDFDHSPFFVNGQLTKWAGNGAPRRAGVSSFGIGGTNAHVILEEAPTQEPSGDGRPWHMLTLSARTNSALEEATAQLANYLSQHPDVNLADVAYTLQIGRRALGHRRAIVCRDGSAATALAELNPKYVYTGVHEPKKRPVVFMFPGQGAQYVDMGRELYAAEPVFRNMVDRCCHLLQPHLNLDLRDLLFPTDDQRTEAEEQLQQTAITQPALFTIEYALAQLWMAWGVQPEAMIGHSIGEYVAACLAGVFTLEDALALVATRGRLMQSLPAGSMLVVTLPEKEVLPLLNDELALAAVNGQTLCVVAGPHAAVDALEADLSAQNVGTRRLHTSHAFHSSMMDPILDEFTATVADMTRNAPQIPYISNVTGDWITPEDATDPTYYARHLRGTVRFAAGVHHLVQDPDWILLEVGPGRTLMTIARWHPSRAAGQIVLTTLPHANAEEYDSDVAFMQTTLGRLWLAGVPINWADFYAEEQRQRIPLPTYPFARQRYWIDPPKARHGGRSGQAGHLKKPDMADWFYAPSWKRTPPLLTDVNSLMAQPMRWLIFMDEGKLGTQLIARLTALGQKTIAVQMGDTFARLTDGDYIINPHESTDYTALLKDVCAQHGMPDKILHLWNVASVQTDTAVNGTCLNGNGYQQNGHHHGVQHDAQVRLAQSDQHLTRSFYSLLYLAQAIGAHHAGDDAAPLGVGVVTSNMHDVLGGEALNPEQATVIGPCRALTKEVPNIVCRAIDIMAARYDTPTNGLIAPGTSPGAHNEWLIDQFIGELTAATEDEDASEPVVAYRGRHRWTQAFEPARLGELSATPAQLSAPTTTPAQLSAPTTTPAQLSAPAVTPPRVRQGGTYLITGGLGGIGLAIADYLARTVQANLVLTGRSLFPAREEWATWLAAYGDDDECSRKIRQLESFEQQGAHVLVLRADVADLAAMQSAMTEATTRFGPIHGVIHAAGVAGGGMMQLKSNAMAASVLDPKVKGTRVLETLFADHPLDFLMLCSSRSSILGGFGQADYCAANAFLDAFAQYKSAQDGSWTVAVNWSGWEEVGMRVNTLTQMGMGASGPQEADADTAGAEAAIRETDHPLLQKVVHETPERTAYITAFNVADHWVLDDHRIVKKAVIPGVTYLEMPRAALAKEAGDRTIEIRDIFFLSAVGVRDDETRDVRTVVEKEGDGYAFRMGTKTTGQDGAETWHDHVFGKAAIVDAGPPITHDIDALIARCNVREVVATDEPLTHEDLGPRWQNLKRAYIGENEMVAVLELAAEFDVDFDHFKLHCGLLDRTNGAAKIYLAGEGLYMPMGYKRVTIKAPLPRKVYAYHTFDEAKDPTRETITFDVILMDEEGVELVVIEAFSQKRVNILAEPIKKISGDQPQRMTTPPEPAKSTTPSAPSSTGIRPAEGVEVFRRILASNGLAQVVVSPNDLHASIQLANSARPARITEEIEKIDIVRPAHPRPAMTTDFVAPRNDREAQIADIWQTTLGIAEIGIHDNFFELGGDSVAGIQMIAKFNRAGYQLSPQQLFQHQTIAELAAVLGTNAGQDETAEMAAVQEAEEFALVDLEEDELAGVLAKFQ